MKKGLMLSALILGMFLIFSLNFASATLKSYDSQNKIVTLKSNFLFIPTGDIAQVKLLTPLDNHVGLGYQEIAEMQITGFKDYQDFISQLEFYNIRNKNKKIDRSYDLKVKGTEQVSVADFSTVQIGTSANGTAIYEDQIIGSHSENKTVWTKLTPADLNKGQNVTIGIFTDVQLGDKVEWIPTIAGLQVNEWATWTADLNVGLPHYYPLNETSGSIANDEVGTLDGTNSQLEYGQTINSKYASTYGGNTSSKTVIGNLLSDWGTASFDFWIKTSASPSTSGSGILSNENSGKNDDVEFYVDDGTQGCSSGKLNFNRADATTNQYYSACSTTTVNDGNKHMIGGVFNSTGMYLFIDGNMEGYNSFNEASTSGSASNWQLGVNYLNGNVYDGSVNRLGVWNRTLTGTEISQLYNSGTGITYQSSFGKINIDLTNPTNDEHFGTGNINFSSEITKTAPVGIENVTIKITQTNGTLIYTDTNTSKLDGVYNWESSFSEGIYNYSVSAWGNDSNLYLSSNRNFVVDLTNPVVGNLSANVSGDVFGYPKQLGISLNATDTNLEDCWGSLDGGANQSLNCNSIKNVGQIEEGNHTFQAWANDSSGRISAETNLSFEVDYYTHNVTFKDGLNSSLSLSPNCEFLGTNETAYPYHYDIHSTTSREVNCYLLGYGGFNFNLTESNYTNQIYNVTPAMLNLTFDERTNVTLTWLGGGLSFNNVTNVTIPMRDVESGQIIVDFNDNTQSYSFYNDLDTSYSDLLHLETIDFDQPVKVLDSSSEINGALVTFKKTINGTTMTTYSAFTDINGIAHILINDGNSYEIYVSATGYEDYSELKYIPTSNTDTIIINLASSTGTTGNYFFSSSCGDVVGSERNCSFYVKSYTDKNITFNYTWNGGNYSVTSLTDEATLTLLANSTTTPIYVTASVNPTKNYAISWNDITNRSIQLTFDATSIKDESLGILVLFYAIIFIIGILLAVSVNRIPKMQGKGAWAMVVWFGIIAIQFPLLWFVVAPAVIYAIFKTFWGTED